MTGRLTPEREAQIRRDDAGYREPRFPELAVFQRRELLGEIDALRSELAAVTAERDTLLTEWDDGDCDTLDNMEESMTGELRKPHKQIHAEAKARELAAAEQKGRGLERADVSWYLRSTPRAGGELIGIEHSNTVARLAGDIERGEHRKP